MGLKSSNVKASHLRRGFIFCINTKRGSKLFWVLFGVSPLFYVGYITDKVAEFLCVSSLLTNRCDTCAHRMESGVIQHHHIVSAPARPFGVFSPVCVQPFLPVPEGQRKCLARVRVVMG